jgi:hypothetical protein
MMGLDQMSTRHHMYIYTGIQSHKPDDSHSLTGASSFYRNQRAILDWCVFVKGPPSVLPMWARSLRFCFVTLCAIVEWFRATEPRPCHNRIGITVGHRSRQTVTVDGRAPEYTVTVASRTQIAHGLGSPSMLGRQCHCDAAQTHEALKESIGTKLNETQIVLQLLSSVPDM